MFPFYQCLLKVQNLEKEKKKRCKSFNKKGKKRTLLLLFKSDKTSSNS